MRTLDSFLYAVAAGQALLIGAMLLRSPEATHKAVRYLAAILGVFAGLFGVVLLKEHTAPAWAARLDLPLGLGLGPLLWLHAAACMGRRPGSMSRDLPWLLPVVPGLLSAAGLIRGAAALRLGMLALLAAAVASSLFALTRFVRRFDDLYAEAGPERMSWLRDTHALLAVIVAAGLTQHFAEQGGLTALNRALIYAIPVVFIVLNIEIALNLITVRAIDTRRITRPASATRDVLDEEELASIHARLRATMEQEHRYRDPSLQLRTLAEAAGAAETSITEAIRRGLARNFFDFVNGYRIREAQDRLAAKDASVTQVMLAVGFNSKSSFYAEFRKRTGVPPRSFTGQ